MSDYPLVVNMNTDTTDTDTHTHTHTQTHISFAQLFSKQLESGS